jgi:SAM-dependent methyltransferase
MESVDPHGEGQGFQDAFYDEDVDYGRGSPHLKDPRLKRRLLAVVGAAVQGLQSRGLPLRVLEVGAGHGGYTEALLAAGCSVTAVEMSRASVGHLRRRFGAHAGFRVVHDPTGDLQDVDGGYSMVACVSVLHHIPDYGGFVTAVLPRLTPGGSFLCLQDPIWYDRVPGLQRRVERLAYLAWRLRQGNMSQGLATTLRRARGIYDESNPSDMVEYHVVRRGVDEKMLADALKVRFDVVTVVPYWSTQTRALTRLGDRLRWQNTFGIHAQGYEPLSQG